MSWARTALSLLALAAACRDQSAPARRDDDKLGQRVFQPAPGVVRAVPPHSIQPDGVGPYALGTELKDILNTLPHGPRVELLQIEHIVSYRLVRAAQDTILVGIGPDGRVSFVVVLDPDIAKAGVGLGVGSTIDQLRTALGPERPFAGARDPRLVELERLRNARSLVETGIVTAIVVGPVAPARPGDIAAADALSGGAGTPRSPSAASRSSAPPAAPPPATPEAADPSDDACTPASAGLALSAEPVASVARARDSDSAVIHYGCFTGPEPEAVVEDGDDLVLVVGEPGRLRRAAALSVPGLLFASPVDGSGDGRHELLAVSEKRTSDALSVRVEVLRGESGRLVSAGAEEAYEVTSAEAAPVGARLKDISLLIEAHAGAEALDVGGLFLHQVGGKVRTLAPLLPRTIMLSPRRKSGAASGGSTGATEESASPEPERADASGEEASVPAPSAATRAGARGIRPSAQRRNGATRRQ